MTQFEKALIAELKGIRKELSKLNRKDDVAVKIPSPEKLIEQQLAYLELKNQQPPRTFVDGVPLEGIAATYDPLGRS